MEALSAARLLTVWEQGTGLPLARRALLLLAVANPGTPLADLAQLPVGRRDAGLLALREALFGPRLTSLATCPACGALIELTFNVADIQVAPAAEAGDTFSLELAGYAVQFRLPTAHDLIALDEQAGDRAPRDWLLARCLLAVEPAGAAPVVADLPPPVVEAIVSRMVEADPQADVQLNLTCPECAHGWQAPFDIVAFLWSELHAWAGRLLRDVHALARAYGWSEADILALSPRRRQFYLEMVSG